jgi:deoxyribose-phosphate aldolase
MLDVPVFPELVAVIVAEPAATPVTTPLELTVAAAVLLLDQVTVCPVITLPFWSLTVAWRVVVVPATIDTDGGATVTVVTTGGTAVTVMLDVPVFPELVAVIVAEPAATPVTTPLELTVAAAVLLLDQVTVCPVITLPFWSLTVASKAAVPRGATDADGGETVTDVTTGAGGVIDWVEVAATFERPPNTAPPFSVPRNATIWKL